VINLVENAIKYAPGTDVVKIEIAPNGGSHLEVRVIDRGPGIDPDDRERIFERFYRGKRAGERQVRGSGIGLSLVQHVVDAHGGEIVIEPTPGGGSTFVLRIPISGPPS